MTDDVQPAATLADGIDDDANVVTEQTSGIALHIFRAIILAALVVWATWILVGSMFGWLGRPFPFLK